MNSDEVVDTLNVLIETCEDGARGFRVCADDADDPQLKTFFANRAQACARAAEELRERVRARGGVPAAGGGWAGTMHRRWVDIRSLISGRSDRAVLEECERGEDVALASYRWALERHLPEPERSVVEQHLQGVQRNRDQVSTLRNRYAEF